MAETAKTTPMLEQYQKVRDKYPGYLLFYRLGDFYEMFYDDAVTVSRELELTLTARAGVPMCGVPHHASEIYIKRLIGAGYKVAVCEQLTLPGAKGIIERDVVRIVTPGTVLEDSMLPESRNNFLGCFYVDGKTAGMAFADISTGEMHVHEYTAAVKKNSGKSADSTDFPDLQNAVITELSRYNPVELLFNDAFVDLSKVGLFVREKLSGCTGEILPKESFAADEKDFFLDNARLIAKQFHAESIAELGLQNYPAASRAVAALLRYLEFTQKSAVSRFTVQGLNIHSDRDGMRLSAAAMRNLELTETLRGRERRGSLMWVLDKTVTSMGRRLLRSYIERPLTDHLEILRRLDAVEDFTKSQIVLTELRAALSAVSDIERLMTRVVYKTASPHDVLALGKAFGQIPAVIAVIDGLELVSSLLRDKIAQIDLQSAEKISVLIMNALDSDSIAAATSASLTKDGGYIKTGFNPELDRLRQIMSGNSDELRELEQRERELTGIKNLRVSYNRVFGYYIEISKASLANLAEAPERYTRRQTLANGERFITEELKKIEDEQMSASDKALALEAEIIAQVKDFVAGELDAVSRTAAAVAELDVLSGLARAAIENDYHRPEISLSDEVSIRDGRHPVIEKMLVGAPFTPNDIYLDQRDNRLLIITGPNMAGKSTYMRQTALIVLMAQLGSFVPAAYARIGVVDQIFTRIGASDDLSAGQSTFMVEMTEVAEILAGATAKSLVILDEIGRGTSTFDGISIARAVAEYISGKTIGCKTLFATHYHELTALADLNPGRGIKNFSVAAVKRGDALEFLHKIIPGGADDSYGIEVAALANLPQKVISAAKAALAEMERVSRLDLEHKLQINDNKRTQDSFIRLGKDRVLARIASIDTENLSEKDALELLKQLKQELE